MKGLFEAYELLICAVLIISQRLPSGHSQAPLRGAILEGCQASALQDFCGFSTHGIHHVST